MRAGNEDVLKDMNARVLLYGRTKTKAEEQRVMRFFPPNQSPDKGHFWWGCWPFSLWAPIVANRCSCLLGGPSIVSMHRWTRMILFNKCRNGIHGDKRVGPSSKSG